MIVAAALTLLSQDSLPTASEVVTKMIARYHSSKTLKGDTTSTIEVGSQKFVVLTKFQFERPGKMYLHQSVENMDISYTVTSDGKEFSYQKPIDTPRTDRFPNGRLIEDFTEGMGLGDIYRAAAQSLAERSSALDLLISDQRDLVAIRDQWVTMKLTGKEELSGESVYRIVGTWRLNKQSEVSANFGMFVTADGDLKKYVIDSQPKPEDTEKEPKVTRTTLVNVALDGEVDQKLFKLLK